MFFDNVLKILQEDDELRAIADEHFRGGTGTRGYFSTISGCASCLILCLRIVRKLDAKFRTRPVEAPRGASIDIARYVERLRDLQAVKVRRLQMLRNTVVHDHDALYQDERMVYQAREAHEIFDDALDKMVGEVLREDSECENIDWLIQKYDDQPWANSSIMLKLPLSTMPKQGIDTPLLGACTAVKKNLCVLSSPDA